MEQLVHLRLKSIYKAFKQSSRKANGMTIEELEETKNINNNSNEDDDEDDDEEDAILNTSGGKHGKSHIGGSSKGNTTSANSAASSAAANLVLETEKYMAEKQKADAAAEALLAELEEEEEAIKSKKSKKKRKKEKKQQQHLEQQAKQEEEGEEEQQQKQKAEKSTIDTDSREGNSQQSSASASPSSPAVAPNKESPEKAQNTPETAVDPAEIRLLELVEQEDEEGLEEFLFELKGVPGRAALRKNAKKALKRLRSAAEEEAAAAAMAIESPQPVDTSLGRGTSLLLKMISNNHVAKSNRVECVMAISPLVVGRVIGKGGQRIRDLMEESGAKVWIDQEKVDKPGDPRNVYISGERQCVDQAVTMMKEIVSQAPAKIVGGNGEDLGLEEVEQANTAPTISTVENSEPASAVQQQTNSTLISQQIDRALKDAQYQVTAKNVVVASKPKVARIPPQPTAPKTPSDEGEFPPDFAEQLLTCEARFVPLLIGKRGWTIKHIQDESGARVDIDQTVTPRHIHISGLKKNVDVAIGMVRDVLSYPHAQLMQTDEKQTIDMTNQETPTALERKVGPNAAAPNVSSDRDDRDNFSPPAALIMTGDSKSLISASSSLSSTPEPSMASNPPNPPKGFQLPAGPLIPPEYNPGGGNSNNHMLRSQPPTTAFNGHQEIGFNNPVGVMPHGFGAPSYANPPGSMGIHNTPALGFPNQHQQHHQHQMYNPAPKAPMPPPMGSNRLEGFEPPNSMLPNLGNSAHQAHRLNFNMMGNNNSNGPSFPFPGHAQQGNLQYRNDDRQGNRLRNVVPPLGGGRMDTSSAFHTDTTLAGASTGLWSPSSAKPIGTAALQKPNHGGYYVDDARNQNKQQQQRVSDPNPLGFNLGQTAASSASAEVQNSTVPSLDSNPLPRQSGDDSKMVDSLFAPAVDANQPETLLGGFNGLAITGDQIGGSTGLWGTSGISSTWEPAKRVSVQDKDTEGTNSDLLSGLPPLHLPDDQHQHPPQSRFNWSSTNA